MDATLPDERDIAAMRELSRNAADRAREVLANNFGDVATWSAECLLIVATAIRMQVAGDSSNPVFHILQSMHRAMDQTIKPKKKSRNHKPRPYHKTERWYKSRGIICVGPSESDFS